MTLLKTLKLNCFRNYTQLSFSPFSRTLIVGDNGQGKTNLLEALILLAGGRSFRPFLTESLIQRGEEQAFLLAELWKADKKAILSLSLDRSGKKCFFLNGKKSQGGSLAKELPVILFSPESLSLLKGSAEQRRSYMDEWLNMLGHFRAVREFKRALLHKNRFLKEVRLSLAPFSQPLWESINRVFIEKSLQLSHLREQALRDLSDFLQQSGSFLFSGAQEQWIEPGTVKRSRRPEICIAYERRGVKGTLVEKELQFKAQIGENAEKEKLAGISLYGAHRDDFTGKLNGQDSRYFCSQGQQRGLILALKLAQTLWLSKAVGTSPLLLLDDVFSEIDDNLLLNLLKFLESLSVQTILTATKEPSFLNKGSFQKLYLKEGVFLKEKPYGHHQRKAQILL